MPFAEVNDRAIFYSVRGHHNDRLPALVLLHGAGGSHLDWPPQLRQARITPVYALDLPGHGRSSGDGYDTIEAFAGVILAFLETLGLNKVILVGHSMGGAIAQLVALSHPSIVSGLVLIATGARLRVSNAILDHVLADFQSIVHIMPSMVWARDTPDGMIEQGMKRFAQNRPNSVYQDFVACNNFDVMDRISSIKIPALVICGTADQMTPLKFSQYLSRKMPDARLHVIDDAGHMVMLEHGEEVTAIIEAFTLQLATRQE